MWSQADYGEAFDAETGEASQFADRPLRILWYNEGQARLIRKKAAYIDVTWAAGAREIVTDTKFLQLDKIVWANDAIPEHFRVWGDSLIIEDPKGATAAGGARIYYWAEFPPMVVSHCCDRDDCDRGLRLSLLRALQVLPETRLEPHHLHALLDSSRAERGEHERSSAGVREVLPGLHRLPRGCGAEAACVLLPGIHMRRLTSTEIKAVLALDPHHRHHCPAVRSCR